VPASGRPVREEPPRARIPGKSVKKIILIVVVVLVLAGGGGGAYWWLHRADAAAAAEGATEEKHEGAKEADPNETGLMILDPFLVNLADKDSPRFLRATVQIVISDKAIAEEMTEHDVVKVRIRSSILELLTEQSSEQLVTPEGKAVLKKAIIERASKILTEAKIVDVLFSEFVVQF
jgi:flagellar protein FliL